MNLIPGSFLWFLLFPINRYVIDLFPALEPYSRGFMQDGTSILIKESYVAFIVFTITLTWYLIWVASTIEEICAFLGIKCYSIKPRSKKKAKSRKN